MAGWHHRRPCIIRAESSAPKTNQEHRKHGPLTTCFAIHQVCACIFFLLFVFLPNLPPSFTAPRMHIPQRVKTKKKITYWDAYDGTAIRVVEGGEEEMNTLDVEPSGGAFVSGGDDGLVKVLFMHDTLVPCHGPSRLSWLRASPTTVRRSIGCCVDHEVEPIVWRDNRIVQVSRGRCSIYDSCVEGQAVW